MADTVIFREGVPTRPDIKHDNGFLDKFPRREPRDAIFDGSLWHCRCCSCPQMKTKQIPDDFRDWIEARTFEIGAAIVLPPGCPGLFQANPYSAIRRRPSHWRKSPLKPMQYEALYEALEAAHKILPGAKECDAKDSELRKKIRKLEKAVRKRQEKVARAGGRKNK
jgi:hypothetical protein